MSTRFESKLNKILSNKNYYECIKDLLESNEVKMMDDFIQHGSTTTLEHCIRVSYASYKVARFFHMDYKSAARAGLLHDMFLYDWHLEPPRKLFEKHGFTHPQKALENANSVFELNKVEQNIIKTHMWPLTLRSVPRYKESFLVSCVDKYSSCAETIVPLMSKISNYLL